MKERKLLYSNGLPFTDPLGASIDQQLERIKNKKASCILIDGAIGTGKTTLATHIVNNINEKDKKGKIDLSIKHHPQLSLGGKEFTGCFRVTHKEGLKVIIYDEAGDFNRRGAIRSFNQMINRLFETYRGFKILVIICLPTFHILDSQLFTNNIPRMLIHITNRNSKYAIFKAYSLSGMNWIRYWYDKLPKGASHKCYSKVQPNFYGKFYNLSLADEKALDHLSTYGKKEVLKKAEKDLKGLLCYTDIGEKLGKSVVWVRAALKDLKIKENSIIDRKKCFNKDVLDRLIDYQDEVKQEKKLKIDIGGGPNV